MTNKSVFFMIAVLVALSLNPVFALDCPKFPEQTKNDWEINISAEVKAKVAKIIPLSGAELKTTTRRTTRDLFANIPDAGNLYFEQMMLAKYCSSLRDDKTLTETEKSKRLKSYINEVRQTINSEEQAKKRGSVTGQKTSDPSQAKGDLERQKRESDPKVKINLQQNEGSLLIRIRAEKNVLSLALNIPILGKIVNIHDYNSVTDAVTRSKKVVGENSNLSSNNIELLIENITPKNELSYKIIFNPLPQNISVAGTDRYKISYRWQFAGNLFSKEQWISLQTGELVDEPKVRVEGLFIINRALSPEEIKKLYEDGPKKHEIE
jgi:hypothetical protein